MNIFGGFLVTRRMLEMFKKKNKPAGQAGGQVMSLNVVTLLYCSPASASSKRSKGLSHPTTSIRGNLFGMAGMTIAVLTTAALIVKLAGEGSGLCADRPGGWRRHGAWKAKKVEMTKMPELVAFFHSMIGLAAVFIAVAAVAEPAFGIAPAGRRDPGRQSVELAWAPFIGAITFSGSVIAWGKLRARASSACSRARRWFPGQHALNLALGLATCSSFSASHRRQRWPLASCCSGFVLGVTLIIPIGGADMPVVVSHAQQLLRAGRGGHRLLAQQPDADHRGLAGGLVRRHPQLHHVQGHEPGLSST